MVNQSRRRTRGLEGEFMSLNPPTFVRELFVIAIAGFLGAALVAVIFCSLSIG